MLWAIKLTNVQIINTFNLSLLWNASFELFANSYSFHYSQEVVFTVWRKDTCQKEVKWANDIDKSARCEIPTFKPNTLTMRKHCLLLAKIVSYRPIKDIHWHSWRVNNVIGKWYTWLVGLLQYSLKVHTWRTGIRIREIEVCAHAEHPGRSLDRGRDNLRQKKAKMSTEAGVWEQIQWLSSKT